MTLWRPVGLEELALIYDSGMKAFPARLPEQPIFYPVLNSEYAQQIALEWNAASDKKCGYVLRFEVENEYASRFEKQIVGGEMHEELWIPAEELPQFNAFILSEIQIEKAYFQHGFKGFSPFIPSFGGLADALHQTDVMKQWEAITKLHREGKLNETIQQYNKLIFLHFPYFVLIVKEMEVQIILDLQETWSEYFKFDLCSISEIVSKINL